MALEIAYEIYFVRFMENTILNRPENCVEIILKCLEFETFLMIFAEITVFNHPKNASKYTEII
jgi:hypothetical protein